jgi:hypothetical protein
MTLVGMALWWAWLAAALRQMAGGIRDSEHWPIERDQVAALLDLARGSDEAGFRDLASCLGVRAENLDSLWSGALQRVGKNREASPR